MSKSNRIASLHLMRMGTDVIDDAFYEVEHLMSDSYYQKHILDYENLKESFQKLIENLDLDWGFDYIKVLQKGDYQLFYKALPKMKDFFTPSSMSFFRKSLQRISEAKARAFSQRFELEVTYAKSISRIDKNIKSRLRNVERYSDNLNFAIENLDSVKKYVEDLSPPSLQDLVELKDYGFVTSREVTAFRLANGDETLIKNLWSDVRKAIIESPRYRAYVSHVRGKSGIILNVWDVANFLDEVVDFGYPRKGLSKENLFFLMVELDKKLRKAESLIARVNASIDVKALQSKKKMQRKLLDTVFEANRILELYK